MFSTTTTTPSMFRQPRFKPANTAKVLAQIDDNEIAQEYGVRIKGKIKASPTNWDDLPVSKQKDKSWKLIRKQKYKNIF